MVFHWSLSDTKYPQVSRTLLSILGDLNNAVVWIVSTDSFISKSSSPFTKPLGIVPSTLITIGITITFMFHTIKFSGKVSVLISLSHSFDFTLLIHQDVKVHYLVGSLFGYFGHLDKVS